MDISASASRARRRAVSRPATVAIHALEAGDRLHAPREIFIARYQALLDLLDAEAITVRVTKMADGFDGALLCCYKSRAHPASRLPSRHGVGPELGLEDRARGSESAGARR